jgi:hypothetical protein
VKLARLRRPKVACSPSYAEYGPNTNAEYYEPLVTLRGGHAQEEWGKRRKLRTRIWLIYSLYKNEYRNLKLAETTIRKGLR